MGGLGEEESYEGGPRVSISKGLGEEESSEGGPRVSISKGWEGWARRRAMKVDLGKVGRGGQEGGPRVSISKGWEGWARRRAMKVDLGYQSVRGGRVGRGGQL